MSSLLSLTRAHRRDSPIPPRARHFISDTLLQAIPQHRSRPVRMSHRASGVCDPLHDLSRCSIVDRMESLRRWEASWRELGRYLSAAAPPRLVIPQRGTCSALSFSAMIICSQSTGRAIRRVCASLHSYTSICCDALRTGQHNWKKSTIRRIQ
ncbi:hypothetical protein BGY98DRAFT_661386 [Russula aff. rugulosa BPL654]|nr:hypothetical protein BGY98DRAFT_661386 [Russula aff. rugulosa BPL654]